MPPKKGKKGGKKGKGKGKDKKDDKAEEQRAGTPQPTEKEDLLQRELDQLTEELNELKQNVDDLRQENDWLQQEAHKVRVESHEYMSYMEKKTNKRQTTIISLSDQNQKEIQDLKHQKQNMLDQYDEKKSALRAILMEKENMLSKTKQELVDLQEYKTLQQEQLSRIRELEKEVMTMRGKHSDAIQQLKSRFLKEKKDFQHDSESKVNQMAKQSNKEALDCLNQHTDKIKLNNRQLRHELLLLIRKTRALHEHRQHLNEQKRQLLMEQQYARDLKTLRHTRQHKVLKSFGILDEDDVDNDSEFGETGLYASALPARK